MELNMDEEPYCYYDDICIVIAEIMQLHRDLSDNFARKTSQKIINLKKKQIRDICDIYDNDKTFILKHPFHTLIKDYVGELNNLTIDIDLEYVYADYDFRLRVKQNESIVNKVKYYRVGKEENGQFPINKCLNDLLGFRICIKNFDHTCEYFNEICERIKTQYRIKCIDASKGNYKATHIYFNGDNNKCFPWELQIWDSKDVETNEESHKLHKQEYIDWAADYKNSLE